MPLISSLVKSWRQLSEMARSDILSLSFLTGEAVFSILSRSVPCIGLNWRNQVKFNTMAWSVVCSALFYGSIAMGFDHQHLAWTKLLGTFLDSSGDVHYSKWKGDQSGLNQYLANLSAVSRKNFDQWTVGERKAFLINAYNSFTVKLILDNYPLAGIRSIRLIGSPWKIEFFSLLDGALTSLDPIEHEWLRGDKVYRDPRIHAGLNCASSSCPRLWKEAFRADILDSQLNDAVRLWLADSRKNQFDRVKKIARISEIFKWFGEDFGGERGIPSFLRTYGPEAASFLDGDHSIEFLDYDWSLNEAK
jgi:hypothetical protein